MNRIGIAGQDSSYNTTMRPRACPLMTPEQIRSRPVWLVRHIAGDQKPPSAPRNKRAAKTGYNLGRRAAGVVFYKIDKAGRYVWDIRIFCWLDDYDYLLEIMTPEEFVDNVSDSASADFVVRQLYGGQA